MRILIAEDDEALARFVRQGLEAEHYSVDVVADGEQARTAAIERAYDTVILDLNLPKLDGVSGLRELRMKKPSLPVLILTQRTKVEDRVVCLDTGADDYLAKTLLVFRTVGEAAGAAAPQPFAFGISVGGGRFETGPGAADCGALRQANRTHGEGIRAARVPDAQRRAGRHARHDHRACVESVLRYDDERSRRLYQLCLSSSRPAQVRQAGHGDSGGLSGTRSFFRVYDQGSYRDR